MHCLHWICLDHVVTARWDYCASGYDRELEVNEETRSEIRADIDNLLAHKLHAEKSATYDAASVESVIKEVNFFASGDRRRLVVTGEAANLTIETSVETAEIRVYEF